MYVLWIWILTAFICTVIYVNDTENVYIFGETISVETDVRMKNRFDPHKGETTEKKIYLNQTSKENIFEIVPSIWKQDQPSGNKVKTSLLVSNIFSLATGTQFSQYLNVATLSLLKHWENINQSLRENQTGQYFIYLFDFCSTLS